MEFERRNRFKNKSMKAKEYLAILSFLTCFSSPFIFIEGTTYLARNDVKLHPGNLIMSLAALTTCGLVLNSRLSKNEQPVSDSPVLEYIEWPETQPIQVDTSISRSDTYRDVPPEYFKLTQPLKDYTYTSDQRH